MPSSTSSSDNAYPAVKTTFFDPEHVDRPIPARPWRGVLISALTAVILLTIGWEIYWRGKGYIPGDYKNDSGMWAHERRKATADATVVIGSSRAYYDVDVDLWEELTDVRPIQLSLEGTSARVTLSNLAEDESFHGTLIVGVTALLFFTQEGGKREDVLQYWRDETPSQRFDHRLSHILDRYLAFIDEQTRPKRQMTIAMLPLREGMKPRFDPRKLEIVTMDRNAEVWDRVMTDEVYREEAKQQWRNAFELFAPPPTPDGSPPPPMPDEAIDAVIADVNADIEKIRTRGGDVVFIQPPYDGEFAMIEDNGFPRERFWDRLLEKTDSAGVTFKDHPEMQTLYLPEWSHLGPRDAEAYTRLLAPALYAELEKKKADRTAR